MPDPASLFGLGLTYGLTVCSLTCLPILTPYLMGTGTGFKNGITNSFCFMSGKLLVYAALGGIAAFIGHSLDLSGNSSIIMGLIIVIVGLSMPLINRKKCGNKCRSAGKNISMLAMGASSSLVPCPPVAAIFMLAAQRGSIPHGIFYGLIYGLGLVVSPLIIAGGGLSFISSSIREQIGNKMVYIEWLAMFIMVGMGIKIIMVS